MAETQPTMKINLEVTNDVADVMRAFARDEIRKALVDLRTDFYLSGDTTGGDRVDRTIDQLDARAGGQ